MLSKTRRQIRHSSNLQTLEREEGVATPQQSCTSTPYFGFYCTNHFIVKHLITLLWKVSLPLRQLPDYNIKSKRSGEWATVRTGTETASRGRRQTGSQTTTGNQEVEGVRNRESEADDDQSFRHIWAAVSDSWTWTKIPHSHFFFHHSEVGLSTLMH